VASEGQAGEDILAPAGLLEGGCHCGAVRFRVRSGQDIDVLECNCSICGQTGYLHLIVRLVDFELLAGGDALSEYRFNTGVARHLFCRRCGIKSFYVPRSHPDGVSVNARCLDAGAVRSMTVRSFDGRHWDEARSTLGA
jgi:hypothetical protein